MKILIMVWINYDFFWRLFYDIYLGIVEYVINMLVLVGRVFVGRIFGLINVLISFVGNVVLRSCFVVSFIREFLRIWVLFVMLVLWLKLFLRYVCMKNNFGLLIRFLVLFLLKSISRLGIDIRILLIL